MLKQKKIYLILVFLCFLVYFNSLNNTFISDDAAILKNPLISQPYRYLLDPYTFLNSLAYVAGGNNPFLFHFVSIAFHSINSILVFLFLGVFFKSESSFLGAAFFALHPIHTEAVTWISGRPYIVATFFMFIVYFLYYRSTNPVLSGRKNKILLYGCALSIYVYTMFNAHFLMYLLPLFIILSDVASDSWRRNYKWWIPFIVIVALKFILSQNMVSDRVADMRNAAGMHILNNPASYFIYSLSSHLWLLIWPKKLVFFHNPVVIPGFLHYCGLFLLFLIILLVFFTFKKARKMFFALGIFIIFLSPAYSPIPVTSLLAERYVYFPSVAFSMFLSFLYERCGEKSAKYKKLLLFLCIFILTAYSVRTVVRNEDWRTAERFWKQTAEVSDKNARAQNNIGAVYLEKGELKRAVVYFKKAVGINPEFFSAYNNLGLAYDRLGDKEKAVLFLNKALQINPRVTTVYYNLGIIYNSMGNKKEAVVCFDKVLNMEGSYLDTAELLRSLEPFRSK